jgi:hypothetical protein
MLPPTLTKDGVLDFIQATDWSPLEYCGLSTAGESVGHREDARAWVGALVWPDEGEFPSPLLKPWPEDDLLRYEPATLLRPFVSALGRRDVGSALKELGRLPPRLTSRCPSGPWASVIARGIQQYNVFAARLFSAMQGSLVKALHFGELGFDPPWPTGRRSAVAVVTDALGHARHFLSFTDNKAPKALVPHAHVHLDHVVHAVRREFLDAELSRRATAGLRVTDVRVTYAVEPRADTDAFVHRLSPSGYCLTGLSLGGATVSETEMLRSGRLVLVEGAGAMVPPVMVMTALPAENEQPKQEALRRAPITWPIFRTRERHEVALWVALAVENPEHWRLRGVALFLEE